MRHKLVKVGEGANPVLIGFMSSIWSRSGGARVEIEAKLLLVLSHIIFCKLEGALEKIVFTTP